MEENKHQFDVFDYEEDGSFKPIFMLGKCTIEKVVDPIYEVVGEEHGTIDTIKSIEIPNPTAPVKTTSFIQRESQQDSNSVEAAIS
jgi:hypothetical protein